MSKEPARKYKPKLAVPLPLDQFVRGLLKVDPSQLSESARSGAKKRAAKKAAPKRKAGKK